MNSYIKPPTLSTNFSQSGKGAKRRFDNILNTKAKKTGVLAFSVIFILVVLTGAFITFNSNLSNNDLVFTQGDYYNLVVEYMNNEFKKTYSPYYEVIDLIVSNYNEAFDEDTKMLEATFYCKMIHKNYYKDPDTVDYIKKAKENGDPHYKTYYNEYNKEMEGNFELCIKTGIKDGKIKPSDVLLYTNVSPKGVKWQKIKDLSVFIMQ